MHRERRGACIMGWHKKDCNALIRDSPHSVRALLRNQRGALYDEPRRGGSARLKIFRHVPRPYCILPSFSSNPLMQPLHFSGTCLVGQRTSSSHEATGRSVSRSHTISPQCPASDGASSLEVPSTRSSWSRSTDPVGAASNAKRKTARQRQF